DGISTGGQSRTPICKLPSVEHTEQTFPLLFLYRKEVIASGGAGKFRGGLSAESCFIPHRTESITQDTLSSGNAIPTSPGMMAGYPGSVNVYKFKRATDIFERLGERRIPGDIAELKGEEVTLALRQENFIQKPDDVYAVIWSAAGGFGDPLERDPEKVRDDAKDHSLRRESDVSAANPNIGDYRRYIDDRPVFRQFSCPGCGALVENEVARADDPVLRDIELDMR